MSSERKFSGNMRLNYAVFNCNKPIMWDEVDPAVHDVEDIDIGVQIYGEKATLFCIPLVRREPVHCEVDASKFKGLSLPRLASLAAIIMLEHLIDCGFDPYYRVNRVTIDNYIHLGEEEDARG
jgi:hypothetical protein